MVRRVRVVDKQDLVSPKKLELPAKVRNWLREMDQSTRGT